MTPAMKLFLGRFGQPLLFVILIGLAVVAIDKRGYDRAAAEEQMRNLERAQITSDVVRAIDGKLELRLGEISADVAGKIQTIDTEGKTVVQPIITRELVRDPSLADPSRCLSPGLLDAVNAARGFPIERDAGAGAGAGSADPARVPGSAAGR